jgi:hypothetical protein
MSIVFKTGQYRRDQYELEQIHDLKGIQSDERSYGEKLELIVFGDGSKKYTFLKNEKQKKIFPNFFNPIKK